LARIKKSKTFIYIIPEIDRELWLERRKESILQDLKLLERIISEKNLPCLYGCNSFSEADKFIKSKLVKEKDSFQDFINMMFKCFFESMENYGNSIQKKKYFNEEIRKNYPSFSNFLDKINVYRNEQDHVLLNRPTNIKLTKMLEEDFLDQSISSISDPYFALQQKCLDSLLVALQLEISNLS
jgi:hypothetical protein